jgi:hypothetical protein
MSQVSRFTLELKPTEELDPGLPKPETDHSDLPRGQSVVIQGNQSDLEGLNQLTEQYVQSWLGRALSPAGMTEDQGVPSAFWDDAPEWQSDSGYSHRLSLGALQVEPILRDLNVTTTQLYDLAEILHQSMAGLRPLVSGSKFSRVLPERSPNWGKTAAVAAIALGLTGGLAWWMGGGSVLRTASDSEPDERVSLTPPSSANNGNSPIRLPPTFPVKPTPPSNSGKQSKTNSAKQVKPPQTGDSNVDATVDSVVTQQNRSQSPGGGAVQEKNEGRNSQEKTVKKSAASSSSSVSKTSGESNPDKDSSRKDVLGNKPKKDGTPASSNPGTSPSLPPGAIAKSPPVAQESAPPPPPQIAPTSASAPAQESVAASDFSIANESSRGAQVKASSTPVLRFFQSQWKGQDSLTQNLQYSITVNPDGSVKSVTPKNEVATKFSQVPLPSPGDALIPPFSGASLATFEVTLYPDGTVSVK